MHLKAFLNKSSNSKSLRYPELLIAIIVYVELVPPLYFYYCCVCEMDTFIINKIDAKTALHQKNLTNYNSFIYKIVDPVK